MSKSRSSRPRNVEVMATDFRKQFDALNESLNENQMVLHRIKSVKSTAHDIMEDILTELNRLQLVESRAGLGPGMNSSRSDIPVAGNSPKSLFVENNRLSALVETGKSENRSLRNKVVDLEQELHHARERIEYFENRLDQEKREKLLWQRERLVMEKTISSLMSKVESMKKPIAQIKALRRAYEDLTRLYNVDLRETDGEIHGSFVGSPSEDSDGDRAPLLVDLTNRLAATEPEKEVVGAMDAVGDESIIIN